MIRDIICLKCVQRRATKFVLNDYSSDYKARLISLRLLSLMYWFKLHDIIFLVKCMKDPAGNFDVTSYVSFVSWCTRASSAAKLKHNFDHFCTTWHFYFNRVIHLWNAVLLIDISQSDPLIKCQIIGFLWDHFIIHFDPDSPCSFHFICSCSSCSHFPYL